MSRRDIPTFRLPKSLLTSCAIAGSFVYFLHLIFPSFYPGILFIFFSQIPARSMGTAFQKVKEAHQISVKFVTRM